MFLHILIMSKTFEQSCHDRNDPPARAAAKIAFNKFEVEDNQARCGVDLFIKENGKVIAYIECERAETWWTNEGPYKGRNSENYPGTRIVRIPSRKFHFLEGKDSAPKGQPNPPLKYGDLPVFFCIVNAPGTDVLVLDSATVLRNYWSEPDNTGYSNDEKDFFICVPIDVCRQKSIKPEKVRARRVED